MINRPVLIKFGAQKRIATHMAVNSPKFKIFHNRHWQIVAGFWSTFVPGRKSKRESRLRDENSIF